MPETVPRAGLTLDAGALIAIERGGARVRRLASRAVSEGRSVSVPAPIVAQAWRGGPRQWLLATFLAGCRIEPVDDALARRAGELQARCGTDDALDALVAVSAAVRGDVILTSDPGDLQRLADGLGGVRVLGI